MEILLQLGANKTAFIQFFIFAITIATLTLFVFTPYYNALDKRQQKTKGAENVSKDAVEEAKNLNLIYQTQAREQNEKIKKIFDTQKIESETLASNILKNAKQESEITVAEAQKNIETQFASAKTQIQTLSHDIATQVTKKIEEGL